MISLYSAPTPNGFKISIALEYLELPYELHKVDISNGAQHEEKFRLISPNGKIPAIVDHANNDFALFESGAILVYLAEKTGRLLGNSPQERYEILQWLMFQVGGIGPMQGQVHVFKYTFNEDVPSVLQRYVTETNRLYKVLDKHLGDRLYVCEELSIADIALFGWAYRHKKTGIDLTTIPHVQRWYENLLAIPAFAKGIQIPDSFA